MKTNFVKIKIAVFLACSFLTAAVAPSNFAQAPPARERIAPQPTATPLATNKSVAAPAQNNAPPPAAPATAKPSATTTISPAPRNLSQTATTALPELQARIRSVLSNPALQRGRVGVKIVSLDSGKTVFEENAEKYFMPASNMKSFTMAAALDRLTPDFRFVTSVYASEKPGADGSLKSDLIIYGRGDPTFAASLNDGDYYRAINALADKIAAAGVRRVAGNLIGDSSYFTGDALGATWEWDDLQWYYGAGASALTINDNSVDLKIAPGGAVGASCYVSIQPANSLFTIVNRTQTAAAGTKREIAVKKLLGANKLEVSGTMPLSGGEYNGAIAVENPAEMFVQILRNALAQKGIVVAGQTGTITNSATAARPLPATNYGLTNSPAAAVQTARVEIARLESAPLSYVAAKTLKPSQNLYTELTLRALGEAVGDKTDLKKTSAEKGLEAVAKFLTEAGIQPDAVVQFDGSGLSRHDLITPAAAAQLYAFMSKHRFAQPFQAALPVGAVDGTLKNRFVNTNAANKVFAKTGTIDQVGTISGYTTTAAGERLAFSILTNNLPDAAIRRQTMDDIVLLLTNFNGKIE